MNNLLEVRALLAEARLALHKIMTKGLVVELQQGNGNSSKRVRYTETNVTLLEKYIRDLETAESRLSGGSEPSGRGLHYFY